MHADQRGDLDEERRQPGDPRLVGGPIDEAIERLVDLISVREGVPREQAALILVNLLGKFERLLDRVPPRTLHLTPIVPLGDAALPSDATS